MKFKSVIISGFRAYDDPKDAQFDFTTTQGNAANFVSIYAPNGFGKTSFYDAVEWAVTNNVSRLWRNEKFTDQQIQNQRELDPKKEQVNLIRNNNLNRPTFVRYLTDKKDEYVEREHKTHGSSKADTRKGEKNDFQNVILSQEWISAFLKEDDGEWRYKKFMVNSDLQSLDTYFQNVRVLVDTNQKKILRLEENINNLQSNIPQAEQEDLLSMFNNQIQKVNSYFKTLGLEQIHLQTSTKEIKELQDWLANAIIEQDNSYELKNFIKQIDIAITGSEDIISKNQFFERKQQEKDLKKKIKEYLEFLGKFDQSDKFYRETDYLIKEIDEINQAKNRVIELLSNFSYYQQVVDSITQKREATISAEEKSNQLKNELELHKRTSLSVETELLSINREKEQLKKDWDSLPLDVNKLTQFELAIVETTRNLEKEKDFKEKTKRSLDKIDQEVQGIETLIQETNEGSYSLLSVKDNPELTYAITQLEKNSEIRLEMNKRIRELNKLIEQQESLHNVLKDFISQGLKLVNETESNSCPLCEHTFENHEELVTIISHNTALSNTVQLFLKQRNELNEEILNLDNFENNIQEKLIAFYEEAIKIPQNYKKEIPDQLKEIQKRIDELQHKLNILKDQRAALSIKFNNRSAKEHEEHLKKNIDEINQRLQQTEDRRKTITNIINVAEQEKRNIDGKKELLTNEIKASNSDPIYKKMIQWFDEFSSEKTISEEFLTSELRAINTVLQSKADHQKNLKEKISALGKELSNTNRSLIEKQLDLLNKDLDKNQRQLEAYLYFLKHQIGISPADFKIEYLDKQLRERKEATEAMLNNCDLKIKDFKRLAEYGKNISPFLESEKAKLELQASEKELKFLKENVTPLLNVEVEKTREQLDEKIKNFFYEDLINEIYKKIDPHPDFTRVEFKANFDFSPPRLDVYVHDENNGRKLIPNLYFSTAQINILSLSIFLATALHSKDYDCIFIDDPIQSMDTINILSTIDLLRGIVVNNNKQIILSTHDKNFHNLLKKKLPSELFESKFLELESFGKLKQHDGSYIS